MYRCPFFEKDIKDVLSQLLNNTKLVYKEVNGTFVISKASEQEDKTVKLAGTVKDVQGTPLPGVTVVIKEPQSEFPLTHKVILP